MNLIQSLRHFTIRTRMYGAIAMVLSLLALVSAAGLYSIQRVGTLAEAFAKTTHHDTVMLASLRSEMGDLRRYEKDLIINLGDADKISSYLAKWSKSIDGAQRHAKDLAAGRQDEGALMAAAIGKAIADYQAKALPVFKKIEAAGLATVKEANSALGDAKKAIYEAETTTEKLTKRLDHEAEMTDAESQAVVRRSTLQFAGVVLLAALLMVPTTLANMASICRPLDQSRLLAERIATGDLSSQVADRGGDEIARLIQALNTMQGSLGSIVGQVRHSSESIQVASAEVASGNADLSQRTEETASNLQQTASSLEQLTGNVRQSADAASQANQLAASASAVASRGGEVVAQVVTTMAEINDSSRRIADIIGTIDGIAFQTNILALNAAVEAARAGEQGRGFAVVASEVRSLAQRSAEAAREIKTLIGASVERVESGTRLVQNAGSTMNEIVASVQRVTDVIGEITAASAEQSSGIGQVNGAVNQLDQMTQQNAALVEESAAAAESLRDQAARLNQAVGTFRLAAAA
jgi:methyl-accepting chemotaxis protein